MKQLMSQTKSLPSVKSLHLLAAVCAGCISPCAVCQVIPWNTTDGLWNVPTNWQGFNTPNTQGETAQFETPGSYTVIHPAIPTSVFGLNLLNSTANLHFEAGSAFRLGAGGILNNSTILLNSNALHLPTSLTILTSTTLSGSGQLILNAAPSQTDSSLITASNSTVSLTQGAAHSTRGTGSIYVNLINNGVVAADIPGQPLHLASTWGTNNNLLTARNGGILHIGCIINQSGFGVILADNSEVTLSSKVGGGLLSATGLNGRFSAMNNTELASISLSGMMNVHSGITTLYRVITNNGTITVNPTSTDIPASLHLLENTSFEGTGEVILNAPSTSPNSAQIQDLADRYRLLNGSTHTISGAGIIDTEIRNFGAIMSSFPGRSLTLLGDPITNFGVIGALAGATLNVTGTITQVLEQGILHADGGYINLSNAYVNDGNLLSTNGGVLRIFNYSTIVNSIINADILIQPHSTLVLGSIAENNGNLLINANPTDGPSTLFIRSSLNLRGTGSIVLNANLSNLGAALIDSAPPVNTLTLASAQSLEGSGRIYCRTICQGTLSPGLASQPIGHLSFGDSGRLTLSPTSTLNIQIGGTDSIQSDLITSSLEPIYLDGTLNISSLTGLTPAPGQTWTIMTGPSFIGTFANIQFPTLSPSGGFRINYLPTSIQLEYFCYADTNEDGGIDGSDIQAFFTLWELSDSAADLNLDGGVDGADLELFFTSWESGNC